jgi:hypothetical protein
MLLAKLNTTTAVLLAGLSLLLGPAVVATRAAGQTATPGPGDKKQEIKVKWQYKALTAPDIEKLAPNGSQDKLTDGLNMLGEQGWELVAVAQGFPEPGGIGGFGMPGAGRPPMPPGGPGGPGMLAGKIKPSTYVFKRPK